MQVRILKLSSAPDRGPLVDHAKGGGKFWTILGKIEFIFI